MIGLGIIGDGRQAGALRAHGAPLGGIRLVDTPMRPWREIALDPGLGAVLVDMPGAAGLAAIIAALEVGKVVICGPAPARDGGELDRLRAAAAGGGILLPGAELTHGEAGRRGLVAMADPAFGRLTSLYIAIRQPCGPGDVLEDLAPEAVAFVTATIADQVNSVRVNAGRLFGADRDSAVILLRTAGDAVVTIEIARCLPASLPAPGLGEVEIDAVGTSRAVRIHRDGGSEVRPWLDAAVLAMLREVESAFDVSPGMEGVERAARNAALLAAIRAA